jgi:hypothetical protein
LSVPLSSKIKQDNFYYKEVKYNNEVYSVIISQIRLLDSKRLIREITTLDKKQNTMRCEIMLRQLYKKTEIT